MKKWAIILVVFAIVLLAPSCMRPPAKVVITEVEGKPVAAWDLNADGVADTNADGSLDVVPGSEKLIGAGDTADSIAPTVLKFLVPITGLSVFGGLAEAWKKYKFGRILANTVMTVQAARKRLKTEGNAEALAIVDETLGTQTKETTAAIRDIKDRLGLKSVSKS